MGNIFEKVNDIKDWQEAIYQDLHANPELSMVESKTRAKIKQYLLDLGYEVQEIGLGVVGVLKNGVGKTVLFRADFDALPVKEESNLAYASKVVMKNKDGELMPAMHACGHDLHVSSALGAARLLAENTDQWSGTYIALFQAGEEIGAGAKAMVNDGLLEKVPKPDICFAQHVLPYPKAGQVGVKAGPFFSRTTSVKIKLYGKGTHGSMPQEGIDTAVLAASIVMRLQTIVAREIAPKDFAIITVGKISVGSLANVIADQGEILLNARAYKDEVFDKLIAGIKHVVHAECEASNVLRPAEISLYDDAPVNSNDQKVTEKVKEAFIDTFGKENVLDLEAQSVSEDFARIPMAFGVPYLYWSFGGFLDLSKAVPNHNPKFVPDLNPSLKTGTKAILSASLAYLKATN